MFEIGINVQAHMLVPPHFLDSTAFKKMIWQHESGKSFPKLSNNCSSTRVNCLNCYDVCGCRSCVIRIDIISMYVCSSHIARVKIDRIRLPILFVVS